MRDKRIPKDVCGEATDRDARREIRIKAIKETVLQQSMVAFGLFEIQFFHAQRQGRENELILP